MYTPEDSPFEKFRTENLKGVAMSPDVLELVAKAYEGGFIDGMQKQMQSSVDRAVNRMAEQPTQQQEPWGACVSGRVFVGRLPEHARKLSEDEGTPIQWLYTSPQPAQQELEELTTQRDKLADILTRTANALKGKPAELSAHSWHDLPEVAQQIKAAQQQEPVAWFDKELNSVKWKDGLRNCDLADQQPFYTSPQPSKPWVGLTDDEIDDAWNCYCDEMGETSINDALDIARAIEAKLREKNA